MIADTFLQKTERLEIEKYKAPKDRLAIIRTHVPFSGALQKHPHEPKKLILVLDPYSTHITYLEFNQKDVHYLERLPSISNLEGETVNITRIWVKKGSVAVRHTPFLVDHTQVQPKS